MPFVVGERFCCVGCKIEGIASQTRGGAINAESASNYIQFEIMDCHFLYCSSGDLGGSIFGIGLDGFVKFTKFGFCRSGNCGHAYGGNGYIMEDSKLLIECNQAYQCWNSTESGDSCFQFIGNDYVLRHVNVSNCVDNGSGGMLMNAGSKTVRATFLQHYGCRCAHAFVAEAGESTGLFVCSKVNLISNKYLSVLLWQDPGRIRLEYACIFNNTGGTSAHGLPEIEFCVGDISLTGVAMTNFTSHDLNDEVHCVYMTETLLKREIKGLKSMLSHLLLSR